MFAVCGCVCVFGVCVFDLLKSLKCCFSSQMVGGVGRSVSLTHSCAAAVSYTDLNRSHTH